MRSLRQPEVCERLRAWVWDRAARSWAARYTPGQGRAGTQVLAEGCGGPATLSDRCGLGEKRKEEAASASSYWPRTRGALTCDDGLLVMLPSPSPSPRLLLYRQEVCGSRGQMAPSGPGDQDPLGPAVTSSCSLSTGREGWELVSQDQL